jgi:phosphatidate cytidylyltransferase
MAKNDIYIRSLTGLVFVVIVVCTSIAGFVPLLCISLFISSLCITEFLRMRGSLSLIQLSFVHTSNALLLFFASGIFANFSQYFLPALLSLCLVYFTIQLFRAGNEVFTAISDSVFAICYVSLPFVCFLLFAKTDAAYNWQRPMLVFILVWSSDTFAYLAGRLLGRTYLFPALSPKKTVEGWIGGTLLAAIAGGILAYYWPWIGMLNGIVLGVLVSIFGTVGDLFESALKRKAGVKDSGNIMPGHGGLLDRFDAFIFAAVVVYTWYQWIG